MGIAWNMEIAAGSTAFSSMFILQSMADLSIFYSLFQFLSLVVYSSPHRGLSYPLLSLFLGV
jgi:hypothetical protein